MKPSDLADRRKAGLPLYDPSSLVVVGPEAVRRETPRASRSAKQTAEPAEQPRFVIASSVTPETIEWMWRGRLPRGKLVILDGDPGTGKSTMTAEIAARVSTGSSLPHEPILTPKPEPASVVYVSYEDDVAATIVPRLVAGGAALDRVGVFDIRGVMPTLNEDGIAEIERRATSMSAKLVVIDPLMVALPADVDAHKDQEVRRVLHMVMAMAERLGAVVIVVRHLNKSNTASAIYRGGGSIGIIGAARVGLMLAKDPSDPERRVLAVSKSNLGRIPPSLGFRLVAEGEDVAHVEWLGEVEYAADDLMVSATPKDPSERSAMDAARDVVRQILADGPVLSDALDADAKAAGISKSAVKRARKALGVRAEKRGVEWWVRLPGQGVQGRNP
jgi:archaellum biogenesis ATPase FlaH